MEVVLPYFCLIVAGTEGSTEMAQTWVTQFVHWYNNIHQHSGINFVTPNKRHDGKDKEILEKRAQIYALAKQKNPCRWSGETRNWSRVEEVQLNTKRTKCKVA